MTTHADADNVDISICATISRVLATKHLRFVTVILTAMFIYQTVSSMQDLETNDVKLAQSGNV